MNLLTAFVAIDFLLCASQICSVSSKSFAQKKPKHVQVSPRIGFSLNEDVLDWKEAYQACRDWNSTLAFPASAFEGEMLTEFLYETGDDTIIDIHLGFHSFFTKGNYTTLNGRDLDEMGYWQWDPQSENGTEQRCGALTVDGMKTIDCDTRLQSICEYTESLFYDYIYGFGYYRFFDSRRNWKEAVATCKIQGANLLTLHSTEEYDAIFNYYSDQGFINGSVNILYGAHQQFGDHWFLTLTDEQVEDSGYDVWAPGEPGDGTGVDFPHVGLRLTNSTTPDADAGMFLLAPKKPKKFICKRDLH